MEEKINIFNRELFNRLYYRWFSEVQEKDPALAKELDNKIIPEMGRRMAYNVKELIPGDFTSIDYLLSALEKTHWYQEDVRVAEKGKDYAVLETHKCCF